MLGIDWLVGTLGSRAGTSWKVLDPSTLLPVGVRWRCVAVPMPIVPMLWLTALVFISLEEGMRGISDLLLAGARDGGLEASRDGSVFGKQSDSYLTVGWTTIPGCMQGKGLGCFGLPQLEAEYDARGVGLA